VGRNIGKMKHHQGRKLKNNLYERSEKAINYRNILKRFLESFLRINKICNFLNY
jgi:hypothetical protein